MANFDDILFANRNQAYGAYALRQAYRHTLSRALVLGTLLFVGALQLPAVYSWVKPDKQTYMKEITLERVEQEKLPDEKIVVPPKQEVAPAVATVKNVMPDVVADAPDEDPPVATVDELETATSGQSTQEGTGEAELILAPEAATGPTVIEKALEVDEPKEETPFIVVEQNPDFPGGQAGLREYLQRNLHYPAAASRASLMGKVYVSFVVNTDGSLTDIQLLKGIGYGCDEEALRVLKAMPRWKPGRQSGRAVRVKFSLPITFTLE